MMYTWTFSNNRVHNVRVDEFFLLSLVVKLCRKWAAIYWYSLGTCPPVFDSLWLDLLYTADVADPLVDSLSSFHVQFYAWLCADWSLFIVSPGNTRWLVAPSRDKERERRERGGGKEREREEREREKRKREKQIKENYNKPRYKDRFSHLR